MSKVICDICGTTYPETAAQCPICGSARVTDQQTAAGPQEEAINSTASYAYVKGGRFSKKNVRKRSKGESTVATAPAPSAAPQPRRRTADPQPQRRPADARKEQDNRKRQEEEEEPNNTGLVIVVVLLMVAIALVLVYLILPYFQSDSEDPTPSDTAGIVQSDDTTPSDDPTTVPCTSLELSNTVIELDLGETWTLTVQTDPIDTTDNLYFYSDDPEIADVDNITGEITMIAEGETVITAVCGTATAQCTVKTPEQPVIDDPVTPAEFNFEFNTPYTDSTYGYGDTTINAQGKTWRAYKTSLDIDPALITWTSDDPSIASIENGIVTAVAPGTTYIHAQYNGITYTCIVRCKFEVQNTSDACTLTHTDVTISIGESFTLKIHDSAGYTLDVTWLCDTEGVTISGNKITGAASGTHKVYCEYNGVKYTCIVRVKS